MHKEISVWNSNRNREVILLWSNRCQYTRCLTYRPINFCYSVYSSKKKNSIWDVVERFLELHDCKKVKIFAKLSSVLEKHSIEIARCRGQCYNNGSNMSGCYKGVWALILEKNPQAIFGTCSPCTLNLCGVHAVEVSPKFKNFLPIFRGSTVYYLLVLLAGKSWYISARPIRQ